MAKTKESGASAKAKIEKQKAQNRERVRRHREKMSEEKLEEKRKYDRDRYETLKKEKKIKPISEMTSREQRKVRQKWKAQNKRKKEIRAQVKLAKANTPPPSPQPGTSQAQDPSNQKKRGRKAVKKDRAKAYRTIDKQKEQIEKLEKKLRKYKKRLERENNKKTGSPSPRKLVRQVVGSQKVSPDIKKQLFVGFALKKQLESSAKGVVGSKIKSQMMRKVIGNKEIRKYRVQRHLRKILPYNSNKVLAQHSDSSVYLRKNREGVRVKQVKAIQNFFMDDSVSKMCPGKKDVVKVGRFTKQRRILLDTLTNLHKRYQEETGNEISQTSFIRSRPKWVQPPKKSDRDTCACLKHANMELLVDALRKPKVIKEKNITELMESIVCSVRSESCMMGTCDTCKERNVTFSYADDFKVKFFKWVGVKEERIIKNKTKIIQKTIKQKNIKPVTSVIKIFNDELVDFKKHLFYAIYQQSQLKNKLNQLGDKELVFRIDFAENYVAKFHTEVQSMHFGASKRQVSMHTGLRYAKCEDKKNTFCFCTVSDQLDHQSHAVWAHLKPILVHSAEEYPNTTAVHFFSDSPSSQYRNRNNIHLFMKTLPTIFPNLTSLSWNFTEAGHGKGPMDGVGGTLKREADKMVANGADIKNASDFTEAHSRSKIFMLEIEPRIVDEMKQTVANTVVPPILGILKARQITSFIGGKIFANKASCFSCDFSTTCSHHHLFEVFPISTPQNPKKKIRLSVEEIYGPSSEDEEVPLDQRLSEPTVVSEEKISKGVFVVVKFDTTKKTHRFLGVCQSSVDNGDFQVMFMKNSSEQDKCTFLPNESDVSFVTVDQVVEFPPQPQIISAGHRVYYKFKKNPIND